MTSKPSTTNCPKSFARMLILSDVVVSRTNFYYSSCVQAVNPILAVLDMLDILDELETIYQVVIAAGSHLFPFRTEKLSPPAPMVLQCNAGE